MPARTFALIMAGGVGARMGADIPKQFITVHDKPIIAYTLERFQRHPEIDAIGVVCVEGWGDVVERYAREYGISKLEWVIPGGASYLDSIREGVYHLEGELGEDDLVLVHNSVQPMLDAEVVSDALRVARAHGAAVSALPYNDQLYVVDADDPTSTTHPLERGTLRRVTTPNVYRFGLIDAAYHRVEDEGIDVSGISGICVMMATLGTRLHFAAGSEKNIKITTKDDIVTFKAFLRDNDETTAR